MSKFINKFATLDAYNAEVDAETLNCPNVSMIESTGAIKYLKQNPPSGIGIKALVASVAGYYTLEDWDALVPLVTALPTEKDTDYVRMVSGSTVTYYKWNDSTSAYATTTDIKPVGTYVKLGSTAGFVIHGTVNSSVKWSSNTSVLIDGVTTATNQAVGLLDYKGKENTDAVLNAVELGTIEDAPLFTWARGLSFADGSEGYVPAMGELSLIKSNLAQVNACREALGQADIVFASRYVWTSTQCSANLAWLWNGSYWDFYGYKPDSPYGVAVCAL